MPIFYRICQPHRAATALDGEGARLFGGRWNPPGVPVVYLAESRALAALEILVHATREAVCLPWTIIEVDVPETLIDRVDNQDLPRAWKSQPNSPAARKFGARWVIDRTNAAIALPSAIIAQEHVIMLNPRHPKYSKVKAGQPGKFFFDSRLAV